ncbi:MAG: IPT/TIG domain-containing protein [Gaiellaceae bacterium]
MTFARAAGRLGETGPILGQGLTGTTSVFLNGTPATFEVVSDTLIRATVPPGATTGYVTVTTPSGTLTSNVPFHVLK